MERVAVDWREGFLENGCRIRVMELGQLSEYVDTLIIGESGYIEILGIDLVDNPKGFDDLQITYRGRKGRKTTTYKQGPFFDSSSQ